MENILINAEKLGFPVTEKEYKPGTIELANEVLRILGDNDLIVIKNHGFIALGKTMKEAGDMALVALERSKVVN